MAENVIQSAEERDRLSVANAESPISPTGHADYDARIDELGLREYVEEVDEQGFSVIPPEKVATPEFVERVRDVVLRIAEERTGNSFSLDQNGNAGKYQGEPQTEGQFIMYYLLFEDPIFEEWLENPVMRTMVDHYMRGEGQLSSLTSFVKWKGGDYGDTMGLHSDTPRTASGVLPETCNDVVNSAFCLTDYSLENGAIAFVPGSHKLCRFPEPGELVDQAVPVEAPAGSLIFFNGNVWHGAFPKLTDGLRLTITTYVCHQRLKTQEQYQWRIPREMLERHDAEFAKFLGAADPMGWQEEGPQFAKFASWMEDPKEVPREILELHQ